jgi:Domain of unknown function (DUF4159)
VITPEYPSRRRLILVTFCRHRIAVIGLLAAVLLAALAAAQGRRRGFGGFGGAPIKMARAEDFDGNFLFCRVLFRNAPDGDGDGWGVDYPRADINLTFRLSELTKVTVTRDAEEGYNHVVVRLTDPFLYRCPFVMMTEPGGAFLDQTEAAELSKYLLKGGFLWADDFWADYAFDHWAGQLAKALPPGQYPIVDVPLDHPLFHTLYDIHRIPQIPSINFWGRSGGTSERGRDSAVPHVRAVFHPEDGHIMVLMTHNTDFGDAFEREGDDHEYFLQFAPEGYAFAVNSLVYSMTH